ncbi:acyltransferase family protein [Fluviispira multicolorata]|uniref:Acyltransferase family protein n=1 Tax=Fluviispira multicolorata TaxID=2654512 RepID=A0A833JET4_9BACT|nr:acyltransferase family protein [Fluviispira multicolorata]KAB8033376.1 acyltransferase family protein [Fluviispira multicolorata]
MRNNIVYRPDIDGLRAIAVILVVLFHLFPEANPGGFIGVDIFFVISGFLISTVIFKNLDNKSFSVSDFYFRRIVRIFPALILVLLSTLLIGWLILLDGEFKNLGKHILGGLGFVSNVIQWKEYTNYFDSELKPLLNLWSLGVEEQFYFVWPFVVIICWRFKKYLLGIIILFLALSFIANIFILFSLEKVNFSYIMPVTRFWEILFGSLLGYISLYKKRDDREIINNIKSFVGISFIILSLIFINSDKLFPGFWALLPVIGTYLIIDSGQNSYINRVFLANRYVVYIGLISYPIYLWHWPLISYNKLLFSDQPPFMSLIIVLILTVLLSIITYHFLEKPIKKINKKFAAYTLLSVSLLAGLIGLGGYIGIIKPYSDQFGMTEYSIAMNDWDFPTKNLQPRKFLDTDYYESKDYKEKILFLGDSNIEQYAPRIERLLIENKNIEKKSIFFTKKGCMPIKNVMTDKNPRCRSFVNDAYKFSEDPEIKTVVIGASWIGYLKDKTKAYYADGIFNEYLAKSPIATDKILHEFQLSIKELVGLKKSVYVILNIPRGEELRPVKMINRSLVGEKFSLNPVNLDKDDIIKSHGSFLKRLKNVAIQAGAQIIDPLDYLCDKDSICPSIFQNKIIYKDSAHLCASFVRDNVKYLDFLILDNKTSVSMNKVE